ncbi:hypothetical protein [Streptomyces sp. CB02400]|uniref:hypothetical protein n=1 Tax=Streptomyces sp. CB02400 TaxID=1703944 RepID=UPI00093B5469|nr:hypothetical protein [Streptomyces sp. CB02400]OKK10820.1 hypothetical protein AMK33_11795 [Streptomyces sp. CB02400]
MNRTPDDSTLARTGAGHTRRWPKALLHGWIGGTATMLFLLVVIGALPLGDGTAFLVLYLALTVSPTVVSYRLLPRTRPHPGIRPKREAPKATAEAAAEAERAITRYGELLHAHPYSPGEAANADELADYRTALDAYEQAKQVAPGQVPTVLAGGRAALDRLSAGNRSASDIAWSRGRGTMKLALPRPAPGVPAVLVFETDVKQPFSVHTRSGRGGRRQILLDGGMGPTSAHVGVPAQDTDVLFVEVTASGPWRIALRRIGEARQLTDGGWLRGHGTETVLRRGGSRVVEFEHRGDTDFTVRRLNRSFRPAGVLAEGRGGARLNIPVPGRCVLRIDTIGDWKLRDPAA